jgi:ATP synthase subunit 6
MYSPLEQFEPVPYWIPLKLGFFYIFCTNVTYILILLWCIFFFINGPFWTFFKINKDIKKLYTVSLFIPNDSSVISLFKFIQIPLDFLVFFYYNFIFKFFFGIFNCLYNSVVFICNLVPNYKFFMFVSLSGYSLNNKMKAIYVYFHNQLFNLSNLSILNYSFNKLKSNSYQNSSYNFTLYLLRVFSCFSFFFKKLTSNLYNIFLISIYNFGLNIVISNFCSSNIKKSLRYFPFFLSIFFFILLLNTIGLIPYSSTLSSYLSVTLFLTLVIIVGAYFTVFSIHGIKFFNLFMPQGCPFGLIFGIIPIEFLSYTFRVVSLSARLFANMMAGHSLLAVLAGFSWVMFNSTNSLIVLIGTIPLLVVFFLFFLETGVSIVQAVVFTILSCMYMDEAVNLSH